jgi:hypothetical protein
MKTAKFSVPAGEWIDIKIRIIGQSLTLWINGAKSFQHQISQNVGDVSMGMLTRIEPQEICTPLVVIEDEFEVLLVPYSQEQFDQQTVKMQAAMLKAMHQPKPLECFDLGETERVVEEVAEPTPSHVWQ